VTRAAGVLAAGALGLVACGAPRGHADAGADAGAGLVSRRSFDIAARLTDPNPPAGAQPMADDFTFSATLDPELGLFFAGAAGFNQVVPMTIEGPGAFHVGEYVQISIRDTPQTFRELQLDTLDLSATDAALMGTGTAQDGSLFVTGHAASATLVGRPDVTPPFLTGTSIEDPFSLFQLNPSEPLPETATARLVGSDGTVVPLVPMLRGDVVKIVDSFLKPDVVLPFAGFQVELDGLVDFAGNHGSEALRLGSLEPPPLLAADGFESATGTVGDASIVGGDAAIAGAFSAYLGTGAPAIRGVEPGPRFYARLPRHAADTKVRLSYRLVAPSFPAQFPGGAFAGSVGGPAGPPVAFEAEMEGAAMPQTDALLGAVRTLELPLSGSVEGEVLVLVEGPAAFLGPSGTGLIIDDVHAE
jgi:hypothetical protein